MTSILEISPQKETRNNCSHLFQQKDTIPYFLPLDYKIIFQETSKSMISHILRRNQFEGMVFTCFLVKIKFSFHWYQTSRYLENLLFFLWRIWRWAWGRVWAQLKIVFDSASFNKTKSIKKTK